MDEWTKPQSTEEWERFNKKVEFSKDIQKRFDILRQLKEEAELLRKELNDICRQCKEPGCGTRTDCEVKKAHEVVYKALKI